MMDRREALLLVERLKRRTSDPKVSTLCEYVHGTDVHGTNPGFRRPDIPWTQPRKCRIARSKAQPPNSISYSIASTMQPVSIESRGKPYRFDCGFEVQVTATVPNIPGSQQSMQLTSSQRRRANPSMQLYKDRRRSTAKP